MVLVTLLTSDLTIKLARARLIECSYSMPTLAPGERSLMRRPVSPVRQGSLVMFLIEAPLMLLPITAVVNVALLTTDRLISIRPYVSGRLLVLRLTPVRRRNTEWQQLL